MCLPCIKRFTWTCFLIFGACEWTLWLDFLFTILHCFYSCSVESFLDIILFVQVLRCQNTLSICEDLQDQRSAGSDLDLRRRLLDSHFELRGSISGRTGVCNHWQFLVTRRPYARDSKAISRRHWHSFGKLLKFLVAVVAMSIVSRCWVWMGRTRYKAVIGHAWRSNNPITIQQWCWFW